VRVRPAEVHEWEQRPAVEGPGPLVPAPMFMAAESQQVEALEAEVMEEESPALRGLTLVIQESLSNFFTLISSRKDYSVLALIWSKDFFFC